MNGFEEAVREELEDSGWTVYRNGWPDFLCRRKKGHDFEYKAVEVKTVKDRLRSNQYEVLMALADLIPVSVFHQKKKEGFFYEERIRDWHDWAHRAARPDFDGLGIA